MNKPTFASLVFAGLALAAPAQAKALVAAPPNLPQRVLRSDVVVVGKVVSVDEQPVQATPYPNNPNKITYQVATVRIAEPLRGVKGLTHLRVAFIPTPKIDSPAVRRPVLFQVNLAAGKEGCFFLQKHHSEDFYVFAPMSVPVLKDAKTYDNDLALVKRTLKVLEEPTAALKAADAKARLFAAGVLVTKYRTRKATPGVPQPAPRKEPVPAEESRLILEAILGADWTEHDAEHVAPPLGLFNMLQLTPEDGWKAPRNNPGGNPVAAIQAAARGWLKTRGGDYRMWRYADD